MDFGRPQQKSSLRPLFLAVAGFATLGLLWVAFSPAPSLPIVTKAVTVLKGDSGDFGTVTFTQPKLGDSVVVSLNLKGLDPSAKRGFHIQYVLRPFAVSHGRC